MALSIVNASAYANFIDAVNMAAGGILYIPPGTTKVQQPISWSMLPDNIYFEGAGDLSILTPDLETYDWVNNNTAIFVKNGISNVTFENLTLDVGLQPRQGTVSGMRFDNANNVKLLGIKVMRATSQGIAFWGSKDILIDCPKVIDCGTDIDILTNDSFGDGIYIGQLWDGSSTPSERVTIRNPYVKASDRQGRIGIVFEGAKYCSISGGFVQGYDREVHWELFNTEHCKMTGVTIVHKPSELGTAYVWNKRYKQHLALYTVGRGNIMTGNTFIGEGAVADYKGEAVDWSSVVDIFKNNVGEGIVRWVDPVKGTLDNSNLLIS